MSDFEYGALFTSEEEAKRKSRKPRERVLPKKHIDEGAIKRVPTPRYRHKHQVLSTREYLYSEEKSKIMGEILGKYMLGTDREQTNVLSCSVEGRILYIVYYDIETVEGKIANVIIWKGAYFADKSFATHVENIIIPRLDIIIERIKDTQGKYMKKYTGKETIEHIVGEACPGLTQDSCQKIAIQILTELNREMQSVVSNMQVLGKHLLKYDTSEKYVKDSFDNKIAGIILGGRDLLWSLNNLQITLIELSEDVFVRLLGLKQKNSNTYDFGIKIKDAYLMQLYETSQ